MQSSQLPHDLCASPILVSSLASVDTESSADPAVPTSKQVARCFRRAKSHRRGRSVDGLVYPCPTIVVVPISPAGNRERSVFGISFFSSPLQLANARLFSRLSSPLWVWDCPDPRVQTSCHTPCRTLNANEETSSMSIFMLSSHFALYTLLKSMHR